MEVKQHNSLARGPYEYITSPAVAEYGYRPGRVNEVHWREVDTGWYRAYYSDGYKTQLLGDFQGRAVMLAAAEDAIRNGAGGGFTSRFEPN